MNSCWLSWRMEFQPIDKLIFVLLLVVSGWLMLDRLGEGSVAIWDEGAYACVADNIVQSGNFFDLELGGEWFALKPPLWFWLQALSISVFGMTAWAIRFPSAVFGIVLPLIVFGYSRHWVGRWAALLSALVLLTFPLVLESARSGKMDIALLIFSALAIYHAFGALHLPANWGWCGFWLGCAILTKGTAGLVSLAIIVVAWFCTSRGCRAHLWWSVLGALILLVVVAPWYGYQTWHHGLTFWRVHLGEQVVQRAGLHASDQIGVGEGRSPADYWFYVRLLWGAPSALGWWGYPALLGLFVLACQIVWERTTWKVWVLVWFLLPLLAATPIMFKSSHYAIPVTIPLALAAGSLCVQIIERLMVVIRGVCYQRALVAGAMVVVLASVLHRPAVSDRQRGMAAMQHLILSFVEEHHPHMLMCQAGETGTVFLSRFGFEKVSPEQLLERMLDTQPVLAAVPVRVLGMLAPQIPAERWFSLLMTANAQQDYALLALVTNISRTTEQNSVYLPEHDWSLFPNPWIARYQLAQFDLLPQYVLNNMVVDGIELLGVTIRASFAAGDWMVVEYLWRCTKPPDRKYSFETSVYDKQSDDFLFGRSSAPLGGALSTTTWKSGWVIRETYWDRIPYDASGGEYELRLTVIDIEGRGEPSASDKVSLLDITVK